MTNTIETARAKYPALMAYIESRSAIHPWYDQLKADESEAEAGTFSDVVADMSRAVADHGSYPYNEAMGRFLGLPIRSNNEPPHGYYMARCIASHHALGAARREAQRLIAEGRELRVVVARSKQTRKGVRFQRFSGPDQIQFEGRDIVIRNGKTKGRLSAQWSVETATQKLVEALRTGAAYGET